MSPYFAKTLHFPLFPEIGGKLKKNYDDLSDPRLDDRGRGILRTPSLHATDGRYIGLKS